MLDISLDEIIIILIRSLEFLVSVARSLALANISPNFSTCMEIDGTIIICTCIQLVSKAIRIYGNK